MAADDEHRAGLLHRAAEWILGYQAGEVLGRPARRAPAGAPGRGAPGARPDALRLTPVVSPTRSETGHDIARAHEPCARCYVPRPVELDRLPTLAHSPEQLWLTLVRLHGRV